MSDRQREILGLLLIAVGFFVLLSLVSYNPAEEPTIGKSIMIDNWMGILGIYVSSYLIRFTLGLGSYVFPFLMIGWGWFLFAKKPVAMARRISLYALAVALILSVSLGLPDAVHPETASLEYRMSGLVGGVIARVLHDFLGLWGSIITLVVAGLATVSGLFRWSLYSPFEALELRWDDYRKKRQQKKATATALEKERQRIEKAASGASEREELQEPPNKKKSLFGFLKRKPKPEPESEPSAEITEPEPQPRPKQPPIPKEEPSKPEPTAEPKPRPAVTREDIEEAQKQETTADESAGFFSVDEEVIEEEIDYDTVQESVRRREYHLPSSELLRAPDEVQEGATHDEMVENAKLLERSLREFGVEAKVVHVAPGPIITRYELEPAKGVRISKFTSLADDLARVMRASRVRVLAPIPGKASVGIEIPNKRTNTVYFKHIINSQAFTSSDHLLTIAMGKTTSGEAYTANLGRMPHLLIAGATGSGKSVCINTIIMSLLYRAKPNELKLILVDPKKLELSVYQQLANYHLITSEDLDEYVITRPENAVTALRAGEVEMERRYDILSKAAVRDIDQYNRRVDSGEYDGEHLPYLVVVIDELADLMITAAKEVEEPIARLAQMARAVGIHLVVATQRPSVDVLTGVIKANFPARIAFQVASKTDSRTILDANGAEKLLGRGDMLFLPPGQPNPIRIHNSFVTLEEIEAVLEHITKQPEAEELELPSLKEANESASFTVGEERDKLFYKALKIVVTHQQGSISLLQRRLRIGYSRAARIIDELADAGIVGEHEGSKARDVLVDETYLRQIEEEGLDI